MWGQFLHPAGELPLRARTPPGLSAHAGLGLRSLEQGPLRLRVCAQGAGKGMEQLGVTRPHRRLRWLPSRQEHLAG